MPEAADLVLDPRKTVTYRVCAALIGGLAKILFRPSVVGADNIPLTGPVLIAPIHRSNVDFAFSLFISPRKVFFMAKEGIFHPAIFGALLTRLGAFPVDRNSADRESLRLSEEVLKRGQALVLFPEGTRKEGTSVEPLHDGAAFIAARTGANDRAGGHRGQRTGHARGGEAAAPQRRFRSWWARLSSRPSARAESRGLKLPRRRKNFVASSKRSTPRPGGA